jgi:polysaccharide pyruvyl transferase WcaK-like protein/molybdenum cofactor biosynthesis enzyme MoaA
MLDIINKIKYFTSGDNYPIEKPLVIQFPVIDICNSRCQMCRIWENSKSDDITIDKLRKGLRNSLFSEVASVGINGGEPTLRKDLKELVQILFEELPSLRSISLITNGYKYQEVIKRITDVSHVVKSHGAKLDLMVSLDGVGDVHDKVRGKIGNFERAEKVIDHFIFSTQVDRLSVGCTIIKDNVYGVNDLFEYCRRKGIYVKYRLGIPHQRLYTNNIQIPYVLSINEKYHISEFIHGLIQHYEDNEMQRFFYRSLIDQILHNIPRKAGCDWKHRGVTITSKGELLYCAVQSRSLGCIDIIDSENAYFSNKDYLKRIINNKCDSCLHDYVGLPPPEYFRKIIVNKVYKKIGLQSLFKNNPFRKYARKYISHARFVVRRSKFEKLTDSQVKLSYPHSVNKKILLCGWYGTETLGDKAILGGVVSALTESLGKCNFILVSLYPYISEITQLQMPELAEVIIVDPLDGVQLVKDMDLVVFGGGPIMALQEMAEMSAIFRRAKIHGVTSVIAGCGVGPLGDPIFNSAISELLTIADIRIYRDEKSKILASSLGVDTKNDHIAEDPAFTWLYNQKGKLDTKKHEKKILLLGLRDFPCQQYASHLNKKECMKIKTNYEIAVIDALKQICLHCSDLVIKPLPMCTNHFGDDDRWFYRNLFRDIDDLFENLDYSLLNIEFSPIQYCNYIANADAFLAMRFHSLVFSLGLDVPAVAIDYTLGRGKVSSLANLFNVPHQSLDTINSNFIATELIKCLDGTVPRESPVNLKFTHKIKMTLSNLGIDSVTY